MTETFPEIGVTPQRDTQTQEFYRWLDSPDGKSALETAAEAARASVQRLNKERTIAPEQLHVPITL